jgi:lipopolysaccharide biosynthesis glycosyltransferase
MIMLAALLKSIERNHLSEENIEVYIVDDNISIRNKIKLSASVNKHIFTLHWIDIKSAIPKGMQLPLVYNSYPLNTYIRLFIPYFIPSDKKKVLFMDVDMIVTEDISKLWNIDIGDHIIGAVTDSITKYAGNLDGGGISNYKELGIPAETKYFNAGLQLINIDKWIEFDTTTKIINCINRNRKYANMGDQYGLNVILGDKYFELDPLWNYMANGNHHKPYLIHFIHRKPFYKSYFNNPRYKSLFYHYLAETAWAHIEPIGEPRRYFKKIGNIFQKLNLLFTYKKTTA